MKKKSASTVLGQIPFVVTSQITSSKAISTEYSSCPTIANKIDTPPASAPSSAKPSSTPTSSPTPSTNPTHTVTSTSVVYTSAPQPSSLQLGGPNSNNHVNAGVVVGSVLGALCAILVLVAFLWIIRYVPHTVIRDSRSTHPVTR